MLNTMVTNRIDNITDMMILNKVLVFMNLIDHVFKYTEDHNEILCLKFHEKDKYISLNYLSNVRLNDKDKKNFDILGSEFIGRGLTQEYRSFLNFINPTTLQENRVNELYIDMSAESIIRSFPNIEFYETMLTTYMPFITRNIWDNKLSLIGIKLHIDLFLTKLYKFSSMTVYEKFFKNENNWVDKIAIDLMLAIMIQISKDHDDLDVFNKSNLLKDIKSCLNSDSFYEMVDLVLEKNTEFDNVIQNKDENI